MSLFKPDWALPDNVKAFCTERKGGVSQPPFDGFNLATHVGDDICKVQANRLRLQELAQLPNNPVWLNQQHTDIAIQLTAESNIDTNTNTRIHNQQTPIADASWTQDKKQVCIVMTADCLPILVAAKDGSCVAAIHAGWKGLADGIITKTLNDMPVEPGAVTAWIGPAISQAEFEVGQDVYDAFCQNNAKNNAFFIKKPHENTKYLADIAAIAQHEMQGLGVSNICLSGLCSFSEKKRFYSYRRDHETGRMASLIWLE